MTQNNPYEELAALWRELKEPFLPFWRFLGSHSHAAEPPQQRSSFWRYIDNTWTALGAIGILAGVVFRIVAVPWAFAFVWVLFSLGLVRAETFDSSARGVKALRFIFISGVVGVLLWAGSRIVPKPQPPAKFPTAAEIAEEVSKIRTNNTVQTDTTNTTKPPRVTVPEVSLIFKESPLFTAERKQRVTAVINDFYLYLKGIGFPIEKELPPLGVSNYNVLSMSGSFPGTIYDRQIYLPKNSLDNADAVRKVYASYVFRRLFGTFGEGSFEKQDYSNDETTATLYEVYYAS